ALPLRVERQTIDKSHDRLVASLGTVAQMDAIRNISEKSTEVQKMALSLGRTPARAERDGLWIRGNVDNIEVEPWLAIAGSFGGPGDKTIAGAPSAIGFAGIDVKAESSLVFGRRMRNLHVEARNQGGTWRIELDSDDIAGSVTWQPTKSGDSGLITARLRKLGLPPEEEASATAVAPAARKDLPALDVTAESYVSKGKDLGKLELKARPEGTDWKIETLTLLNPESDLVASGRWRVQGAAQRTDLEVKLEFRDAAKFLARHGVTDGVRGGVGELKGQLNWIGGPQDFNYPTLNGGFGLEIRRGQFTKVDPGIGKLLGVLNLEALARRLRFDFRDVVAEGYSFDEMAGDIALKNGVMTTNNLHISGPSAKVQIAGSADIAKETQRLKIRVQPALSGGLAAAAAAATVNPIVGAGVLLGSTILRDPVGKMFAGEYDVSGTWVDPKVEKLTGARQAEPNEANGATR
ncbi:MAG: AsmA-like C-terminal region-containing protein, partial [Betaproteobacteria bacterium]